MYLDNNTYYINEYSRSLLLRFKGFCSIPGKYKYNKYFTLESTKEGIETYIECDGKKNYVNYTSIEEINYLLNLIEDAFNNKVFYYKVNRNYFRVLNNKLYCIYNLTKDEGEIELPLNLFKYISSYLNSELSISELAEDSIIKKLHSYGNKDISIDHNFLISECKFININNYYIRIVENKYIHFKYLSSGNKYPFSFIFYNNDLKELEIILNNNY